MTPLARQGDVQVNSQQGTIWRDLRLAGLGALLGLSLTYLLAAADEEMQVPRPQREIQKTIMDLGSYVCRGHQGVAAVVDLGDNIMRFRCRTGTVIEERVVVR